MSAIPEYTAHRPTAFFSVSEYETPATAAMSTTDINVKQFVTHSILRRSKARATTYKLAWRNEEEASDYLLRCGRLVGLVQKTLG